MENNGIKRDYPVLPFKIRNRQQNIRQFKEKQKHNFTYFREALQHHRMHSKRYSRIQIEQNFQFTTIEYLLYYSVSDLVNYFHFFDS